MNPFSLALTAIRVITTLRPTPVEEPAPAPAPKRGKKAATKAVVKKNWKPLLVGLATGVMIASGLYSGNLDTSSALTMLTTLDFNGIMAIFQ